MLTAYYLLTVDGLRVSIPLELLCGGMNIEKSWGDFRWDPEKQFWLSHHQNIDLLINKRHPLASSSSSDTSAGVSTVILDGHHDLRCRVNGTLYSRSSLMICWSEKKKNELCRRGMTKQDREWLFLFGKERATPAWNFLRTWPECQIGIW